MEFLVKYDFDNFIDVNIGDMVEVNVIIDIRIGKFLCVFLNVVLI